MIFKLFILSVLMHIIDDFVLQPVCLSKLKQQSFWKEKAPDALYANDYKIALFIHALSWSIMIILPYLFLTEIPGYAYLPIIIVNTIIHAYIDDIKANKHKMNLIVDQLFHFFQVIATCLVLFDIYF